MKLKIFGSTAEQTMLTASIRRDWEPQTMTQLW